jgi:hypothetical protein
MEDINKELDEKQIEKTEIEQVINEVAEETPKPKKPRSEAQKKAFEKARAKRMENLKLKEEQGKKEVVIAPDPQLAVQDKGVSFEEKPEPVIAPLTTPKKKRGRPKGVKNKKVMKHQEPPPTPDRPYYPHPVDYPIPQAQPPQYAFQGGQVPLNPHAGTIGVPQQYIYQPPPQQAPVNNYYYYGAPPQQVANEEPEYEVVDSDEDEVIEPEHPEIAPEGAPPPTTTNPEFQYQEPLRYRFV